MKSIIYFISLVLITVTSIKTTFSQSTIQNRLVKYTSDYKFKDGIFLDFNQVKNNQPILKKNILFNENIKGTDFFKKLQNSKSVNYRSDSGAIINIPINDIWGYSQNGTINIRWKTEFYRIFSIARYSNFIVNEEVSLNSFNDPFINPTISIPAMSIGGNTSNVIKQYLLDFETGEIMEYTTQNLLKILSVDTELSEEYSNLRNRKKRQLMFLYLRKFNDKYPLMLPANKL